MWAYMIAFLADVDGAAAGSKLAQDLAVERIWRLEVIGCQVHKAPRA